MESGVHSSSSLFRNQDYKMQPNSTVLSQLSKKSKGDLNSYSGS